MSTGFDKFLSRDTENAFISTQNRNTFFNIGPD